LGSCEKQEGSWTCGDGSAEEGFCGSTDAGGHEDAMGAFLDPVDNILATKDGGAPSKVGRQRTEWLSKGVGSTDENRRKWERIGRAAVAACWQHVGSIGFGVASALVAWAAVAVVAAWWQHWLPCRFGIVGVGSMRACRLHSDQRHTWHPLALHQLDLSASAAHTQPW
jgi:hypothetical protein